jgi:hypothetical protein
MWGDNVVDNLVSSGARNEDTVDWGYVQVQLQY